MIKLNLYRSGKDVGVPIKNIYNITSEVDSEGKKFTKVNYTNGGWEKVSQTIDEIIEKIKKSEKH